MLIIVCVVMSWIWHERAEVIQHVWAGGEAGQVFPLKSVRVRRLQDNGHLLGVTVGFSAPQMWPCHCNGLANRLLKPQLSKWILSWCGTATVTPG